MKDLDQRFRQMPLQTPDMILDSVYSGKTMEKEFSELEKVINKNTPFEPEKFLDSLTQPDNATAVLYNIAPGGNVQFPYTDQHVKGDGIRLYEGKVGEMAGNGHKENLKQNAQSIVAKLEAGKYPGLDKREVEMMGLLSNVGKKYTARTGIEPQLKDLATNKVLDPRGQTVFPMANEISSYIAARYFKNMNMSKEEARPFVAAIHAKNQPAVWAQEANKRDEEGFVIGHSLSKEKFIEKYGQVAAGLAEALYKADVGYGDRMQLIAGKPVFERGQSIISSELVEYMKEHPDHAPRAQKRSGETRNAAAGQLHKGVTQVSLRAAVREKVSLNEAHIKAQEDNAQRTRKEEEMKEYERDQAELKRMEEEKDAAMRRMFSTAVRTGIIVEAVSSVTRPLEKAVLAEKDEEKFPERAVRKTRKLGKENKTERIHPSDEKAEIKQQAAVVRVAGGKKEKEKIKGIGKVEKDKDLQMSIR